MAEYPSLVAVVDDEYPIRKAVKRLLKSAGYAVELFASGTEFVESLPIRVPDCVVLDIRMPGMTGFDVQTWLNVHKVALPVVFVTALDSVSDEPLALSAGAVAFLRKPFGDEELLAAIKSSLVANQRKSRT